MDQRRVDDVVFFLVALELKRELVLGELNNPRTAALSVAAALGGMLVPAGFYLVLQFDQPGEHSWGTVMATDTAFVIGCLALLGRRIPQSLCVFMLSWRSLTTSAPFWSWPSAIAVTLLDASRHSELELPGRRWPARRHRLHDGIVHCQSGFRSKPHQCCQIGYLVRLGRYRRGGYRIVGLVVSA